MKKSLNELRDEAYRISREHGFHDGGPRNFGETCALIHSEVSEALEDYRDWDRLGYGIGNERDPLSTYAYDSGGSRVHDPSGRVNSATGALNKPVGIPSEMADIIIRVLDFCGANNVDIEKVVAEKMAYNESRPYKHGKKC